MWTSSAAFDEQTGVVTWTFTSIDPTTLDVPAGNPEEGFLPPDNTSDAGVGFVTYIVAPKSTDTTATVIDAKATVTFQAGLPDQSSLDTAPISNTIDAGAPTSTVAALPASSPLMFTVLWAGQDDAGGSGIASFDIYVSDDGGPFTAWLTGTQSTSATYTGQDGHTYAFYSVATDNVGHVQATPATAQTTTTVHVASGPPGTTPTPTPTTPSPTPTSTPPVMVLGVQWQTRKLSKRKTTKVLVIGFSRAHRPARHGRWATIDWRRSARRRSPAPTRARR